MNLLRLGGGKMNVSYLSIREHPPTSTLWLCIAIVLNLLPYSGLNGSHIMTPMSNASTLLVGFESSCPFKKGKKEKEHERRIEGWKFVITNSLCNL